MHREPRTANREPRPTPTVQLITFHVDPLALLSLFEYRAHCILILSVEEVARVGLPTPARLLRQRQ